MNKIYYIIAFSFILLLGCDNKKTGVRPPNNDFEITFVSSSHFYEPFLFDIASISIIDKDANEVTLLKHNHKVAIPVDGGETTLFKGFGQENEYKAVKIRLDLNKTHIFQAKPMADKVDHQLLSLVDTAGKTVPKERAVFEQTIYSDFQIVSGQKNILSVYFDPALSVGFVAEKPDLPVTFNPLLSFDFVTLENEEGDEPLLSGKEENSDEPFTIKSLINGKLNLKQGFDERELNLTDTVITDRVGEVVPQSAIYKGQKVKIDEGKLTLIPQKLMAIVKERNLDTQQLTCTPVTLNQYLPTQLLTAEQLQWLQTLQLKRIKYDELLTGKVFNDTEMSTLFLSEEPPKDLLINFYGVFDPLNKTFKVDYASPVELDNVSVMLETSSSYLSLDLIETEGSLALNFPVEGIELSAVFHFIDERLTFSPTLTQVVFSENTQFHMTTVNESASDVHQWVGIQDITDENKFWMQKITKLTIDGEISDGILSSMAVFVTVDNSLPEEELEEEQAPPQKTKTNTGAIIGGSIASVAALAGATYLAVKAVQKQRMKKNPSTGYSVPSDHPAMLKNPYFIKVKQVNPAITNTINAALLTHANQNIDYASAETLVQDMADILDEQFPTLSTKSSYNELKGALKYIADGYLDVELENRNPPEDIYQEIDEFDDRLDTEYDVAENRKRAVKLTADDFNELGKSLRTIGTASYISHDVGLKIQDLEDDVYTAPIEAEKTKSSSIFKKIKNPFKGIHFRFRKGK